MSLVPGGSFVYSPPDLNLVLTPEEISADARLMARTMEEFVRREIYPVSDRLEAHEPGLLGALVRKAGALGVLAGNVPEAYGGLNLPKSTLMLLSEKQALNPSFAVTCAVQSGVGVLTLVYFGTPEQKRRYLPLAASGELVVAFCLSESGSGSDALNAQTRATLSPDGRNYVLNGTKMWVTNAELAGLFTVFAKVDGEQFTAFLVEADVPGITLGREENKLGLRGSSTRRVVLDNVAVPVENVLGEIGKGYRPALCALNYGRAAIAANALGMSKELIVCAATYAGQRKQFGKPIAEFGLIRHKLGEMAIRVFAVESAIYRTAGYMDARFSAITLTPQPPLPSTGEGESNSNAADLSEAYRRAAEEYAMECAIVKFTATETLSYVADEALQIHGGYGFTEEFHVARFFRDQRVNRIYEGTNEINRLTVIDRLTKRLGAGSLPDVRDAEPMPSRDDLRAVQLTVGSIRSSASYLFALARREFGDGITEPQEVAGVLADILADLYLVESALIRAVRMRSAAPSVASIANDAVTAFAIDALARLQGRIRYVVNALPIYVAETPRLFQYEDNTLQLRRRVASAVIERSAYPW